MKIKVSEATNIQLDWLVAKCGGYFSTAGQQPAYWESAHGVKHFIAIRDDEGYGVDWTHSSTDWSEGGPIIEREKISIDCIDSTHWCAVSGKKGWLYGPTPLIAAMRCLVSSRLGDMVDAPDELT